MNISQNDGSIFLKNTTFCVRKLSNEKLSVELKQTSAIRIDIQGACLSYRDTVLTIYGPSIVTRIYEF